MYIFFIFLSGLWQEFESSSHVREPFPAQAKNDLKRFLRTAQEFGGSLFSCQWCETYYRVTPLIYYASKLCEDIQQL